MSELWSFQIVEIDEPIDVTGFDVQTSDGTIGKIDEATYDTGAAVSSWIPAGGSSGGSG